MIDSHLCTGTLSLDTQRPTHDNEATPTPGRWRRARPNQQAEETLGAEHTMASALDGITVLDLSDGPAGALATMFLCDHGARVIRVVDINDTVLRRGGYLVWDRGKECIQLDLSQIVPPAQYKHASAINAPTASEDPTASYARLIRAADVLVERFAPSSRYQAIVSFDWLSALNPRLVHCSITAYGQHGPLKDEPPIDDLVMARLGILGSQPGFRPPPVHVVHL